MLRKRTPSPTEADLKIRGRAGLSQPDSHALYRAATGDHTIEGTALAAELRDRLWRIARKRLAALE